MIAVVSNPRLESFLTMLPVAVVTGVGSYLFYAQHNFPIWSSEVVVIGIHHGASCIEHVPNGDWTLADRKYRLSPRPSSQPPHSALSIANDGSDSGYRIQVDFWKLDVMGCLSLGRW